MKYFVGWLAVAWSSALCSSLKLQPLHPGSEFPERFSHSSLLQVRCGDDTSIPKIEPHVLHGYVMGKDGPQWFVVHVAQTLKRYPTHPARRRRDDWLTLPMQAPDQHFHSITQLPLEAPAADGGLGGGDILPRPRMSSSFGT